MVSVNPSENLPASVVAMTREYARLLGERFEGRVLHVRVFGSHARGDAEEDSDVDVAVVVRGLTEAERTDAVDLAYRAWRLHRSTGILSPLVWSEAQLEDRIRSERRIAHDVFSEGIPV
jgi:predicted nucleotidyltransferase